MRALVQQLAEERCRFEHVLEIVEQNQEPPLVNNLSQGAWRLRETTRETEGRGDSRDDALRLVKILERHNVHAVGKRAGLVLTFCEAHADARLADSAHAVHGDESGVVPHKDLLERLELADSANERRASIKALRLRDANLVPQVPRWLCCETVLVGQAAHLVGVRCRHEI